MKEKIIIGAVALIGVLTIFNTYQIATMDTYGPSESKVTARKASREKATTTNAERQKAQKAAKSNEKAAKFDPISEDKIIKPSGPKTSVNFDVYEYDFGNIAQNSNNKYVYTFTNTGKEPLVISKAKGTCGCTVPRWPKEPIAPGESGEIEIIYKPGKQKNKQSKTITITANTEPANTILKVKANVIPDEPSAAAVN
ncbi:MAG: DUF1573 domain-containing protein [Bacteroidetes bacterium]|nr:MAG: DUF1573 domain-containing protein [Bacteroidota bacterium]